MSEKPIKLSVCLLLACLAIPVKADSFILPVSSEACEEIKQDETVASARYRVYDKAALLAVKSSSYIKENTENLNDHSFNVLAYKLVDNVLSNVSITTIREESSKICVELTGSLEKTLVDEVLAGNETLELRADTVEKIAKEVNASYPKSLYETDKTLPLVFVKDLEYYNHKTTPAHTNHIAEKIRFEPQVLITDNKELADYFIVPKLNQSKVEKIDAAHSRYSMSVSIEIQKANGEVVDSQQQNRYIIIDNTKDTQQIARQLLLKLLDDALKALSFTLNNLARTE